MELLFQILLLVMAVIGAAMKENKNADKDEKFDVKGLLASAKEAFQDQEEAAPKNWADLASPPTDDDEDEDEFELTVDGRTLKFEVPFADSAARDGESHYFSPGETGEGHVASMGLSREKQLEQLKTWLEAGLIDEDEYKERKRKLRRG